MAKEKSITELKDEKNQLITKAKEITEAAKGEKRQLKDPETSELGSIQIRCSEINIEVEERNEINTKSGTPHEAPQKRFSILRAIGESIRGSYSDDTLAIIERGKAQMVGMESAGGLIIPVESRANVVAGTPENGGYAVDTDMFDIMTPLTASLVLARAGANIVTGLTNNITIPKYSGTTANWAGETEKAKDGTGTFSKGGFTPKRLAAVTYVSKQMLAQDSIGVELMLRNQIAQAVAQKLESTIFGKEATNTNKPDGFFTVLPVAGGAVDWVKVVGLETSVDVANALNGYLAYITHPTIYGKLKTTVKDSSGAGGFLIDPSGKLLNGHNCLTTTNMASGMQTGGNEYGAIFGNWADYFIGQWRALDLTVDPYTMADEGLVKITINAFFDAGMRREASFKATTWK